MSTRMVAAKKRGSVRVARATGHAGSRVKPASTAICTTDALIDASGAP